ncbi:hypothetical protein Scep_025630 [Stephania cephalantha]|uniref:Uncharacterized protein n=1 Tax=Stephania cephalantha TaxID=152367 RepID=A0AAP0EIK9_9MAGN
MEKCKQPVKSQGVKDNRGQDVAGLGEVGCDVADSSALLTGIVDLGDNFDAPTSMGKNLMIKDYLLETLEAGQLVIMKAHRLGWRPPLHLGGAPA